MGKYGYCCYKIMLIWSHSCFSFDIWRKCVQWQRVWWATPESVCLVGIQWYNLSVPCWLEVLVKDWLVSSSLRLLHDKINVYSKIYLVHLSQSSICISPWLNLLEAPICWILLPSKKRWPTLPSRQIIMCSTYAKQPRRWYCSSESQKSAVQTSILLFKRCSGRCWAFPKQYAPLCMPANNCANLRACARDSGGEDVRALRWWKAITPSCQVAWKLLWQQKSTTCTFKVTNIVRVSSGRKICCRYWLVIQYF